MRRHPLDAVGLTFAVLFLACTALWFVWQIGALSTAGLAIATPVVLIVLGIAGILGTLPRRTHRPGVPDHHDERKTS